MDAPRRRTVNSSRLPLALWDYGGEGPPVLFLHGFLDSGRSFEDLARELAGDCRALCLDWRGHGESAHASADAAYHQLDHLKDLVGVLDELRADGLAPAAWVGHSLGGTIALLLAALRPAETPRLLLLDCVGGYPADAETQAEALGALVDSLRAPKRPFRAFPDRAAAEARIQANNEGLTAAGAERIARHYLAETADGLVPRLDPRLRGPNPYRFPEGHWLHLCAQVAAPVHLLAPEHGYCRRIAQLQERAARFPDAVVEEVPGVGHHLHVDAVPAVAAALRALLARPARGRDAATGASG